MIICDICDETIKNRADIVIIPQVQSVPGVRDICKQCDKKLEISTNKIKRDAMKDERDEIKASIQALKDSKGIVKVYGK